MWYCSKKNMHIASAIFLISLLMVLPVQGEPRYDLHDDLIAHGALEFSGVLDQLPANAPERRNQIIIDDSVYQLSDDCIYRNQNGRMVSIHSFEEGNSVGFFVLDKTLITKIWSLGENKDDDQSERVQETGGDQGNVEIHQEDGVWKN